VTLSCLIVDDNRAFLDAASALLQREGLTVAGVASTSAEALQDVDRLRPQVVLVDVFLGEESGFDLARSLTKNGRGHATAVILISTHAESELSDLLDESPALGFVSKADLSASAIFRIMRGRADGSA
jgi:CheY-like chemotaxis protein